MEILKKFFISHGLKVLLITIIFVVAYILIRRMIPILIKKGTEKRVKKKSNVEIEKRTKTLIRIAINFLTFVTWTIYLLIILDMFGVNITAALAGFGVAGIAIGLGAQSLIKDWLAGFFIFMENQFNVGDVVKIHISTGSAVSGIVEEINLRKTIIRDLDGARHIISNGIIGMVSNLTQEKSRAHLNISVAYKEDLDRVMEIMKKVWGDMAEESEWKEYILDSKPTILRVDNFGESGIIIKLVGETAPLKQWDIMGEYRRRIKKIFDKEKIEIPFPHVKVYMGDK
ncbi:MAG: mechanosensitive ion channel family protein [Candidatus Marinimicrobia bacterium]|nr:mechanosensitive ion channel family protein [Candidatus Neomarinimicrobiota bacterium]